MIPWQDITYLKSGTTAQQRAYRCLSALKIFDDLADFSPVLVSTVCLDIDTASSDLDIICFAPERDRFHSSVTTLYGSFDRFTIRESSRGDALVAGFWFEGLEIEIYAQPLIVTEQRAYRHLCQTARVIAWGGDVMRNAIRRLKEHGIKTEPAVARCLHLKGDPYEAVEALEQLSESDLAYLVASRVPSLEKIDG